MILAHAIRLVPNKTQEGYFRRACGVSRFTYNYALSEWKNLYLQGEKPSGVALKKQFNAIRKDKFPWTYEVHRDCTARPFDNLQKAFNAFFKKRADFPVYKKKNKSRDSFYVANDKFKLMGKHVQLPRIGKIKMRESLRFNGKILSATVKRRANCWFIVVQVDVGEYRLNRTSDDIVGIDLGIKTSMTLSNGDKIDGPKSLKAVQKRLVKLSRRHSKCQKGSNNKKLSNRLAKLHMRIANLRHNFLHKTSTDIIRKNQVVCIEDLNVKGMIKNHKLARAIMDEGWSEFKRQLEYKSLIYNARVLKIDRFYPSSKTCSNCGYVLNSLELSTRYWQCPSCATKHDRDTNAAKNIKQIGMASPELKPVESQPGFKKQEFHQVLLST